MSEDANTVFLLQVENDKASNSFTDSSGKNHQLKLTTGVTSQTSAVKFGTYGGIVTHEDEVEFYSSLLHEVASGGGFTADWWMYIPVNPGSSKYFNTNIFNNGLIKVLFNQNGFTDTTNITVYAYISSSWVSVQTLTIDPWIDDETWYHFAIERDTDGQWYIYVDGDVQAQVDSTAETSALEYSSSPSSVLFFEDTYFSETSKSFYFEDIRLSNTARYGGTSFTIPTAAYDSAVAPTYTPAAGGNDPSTVLLVQCESALEDDDYTDSSGQTLVCGAASDATYNATVAKFGTYCMNLTDLLFTTNTSLDFGTGEFSVDFWIRRTSASNFNFTLTAEDSSGNREFDVNISRISDTIAYITSRTGEGGAAIVGIGVYAIMDVDTWYHVAVERDDSGNCSVYLDGLELPPHEQNTSTTSISLGTSGEISIGSSSFQPYTEEIRISGAERYGQDFVVPAAAYDSSPTGIAGQIDITSHLPTMASSGVIGVSGNVDILSKLPTMSAGAIVYPAGAISIKAELPRMSMEGTVTVIGTMTCIAPLPTFIGGSTGGVISVVAPMPTMEATGIVPLVATIEARPKLPTFEASGLVAVLGTMDCVAPFPTFIASSPSIVGDIDCMAKLPTCQVQATYIESITATMEAIALLPIMKAGGVVGDEVDTEIGHSRNSCTFEEAEDLEDAVLTETLLAYERSSSCT